MLFRSSQIIYGSLDSVAVVDADAKKGAFMSPVLLMNEKPFEAKEAHEVEAFGPVSTIMMILCAVGRRCRYLSRK